MTFEWVRSKYQHDPKCWQATVCKNSWSVIVHYKSAVLFHHSTPPRGVARQLTHLKVPRLSWQRLWEKRRLHSCSAALFEKVVWKIFVEPRRSDRSIGHLLRLHLIKSVACFRDVGNYSEDWNPGSMGLNHRMINTVEGSSRLEMRMNATVDALAMNARFFILQFQIPP